MLPLDTILYAEFTLFDDNDNLIASAKVNRVNAIITDMEIGLNKVHIEIKNAPVVDEMNKYACKIYVDDKLIERCIQEICPCMKFYVSTLTEDTPYNIKVKHRNVTIFSTDLRTASYGVFNYREALNGFTYNIEYPEGTKPPSFCRLEFMGVNGTMDVSCVEDEILFPPQLLGFAVVTIKDGLNNTMHTNVIKRVNGEVAHLNTGVMNVEWLLSNVAVIDDSNINSCKIFIDGKLSSKCIAQTCNCVNYKLDNLQENTTYNVVVKYHKLVLFVHEFRTASIGNIEIYQAFDSVAYTIEYPENAIIPTYCKTVFQGQLKSTPASCVNELVSIPSSVGLASVMLVTDDFNNVLHTVSVKRVNAEVDWILQGIYNIKLALKDAPMITEANQDSCKVYLNDELVPECEAAGCSCYKLSFEDLTPDTSYSIKVTYEDAAIFSRTYKTAQVGELIVKEALNGFKYQLKYSENATVPTSCKAKLGNGTKTTVSCEDGKLIFPQNVLAQTSFVIYDTFNSVIHEVTVKRVNAKVDNLDRGLYNLKVALKDAPLVGAFNKKSCKVYLNEQLLDECLLGKCDCLDLTFKSLVKNTEYAIAVLQEDLIVFAKSFKTAGTGSITIKEAYDGFHYSIKYLEGVEMPTKCQIVFKNKLPADVPCTEEFVKLPLGADFTNNFKIIDGFSRVLHNKVVQRVNAKVYSQVKYDNNLELVLFDAPLIDDSNDKSCKIYLDLTVLPECALGNCDCLDFTVYDIDPNERHLIRVTYGGLTVFYSIYYSTEIFIKEGVDGFEFSINFTTPTHIPNNCQMQFTNGMKVPVSCTHDIVLLPDDSELSTNVTLLDGIDNIIETLLITRTNAQIDTLNRGVNNLNLKIKDAPLIDEVNQDSCKVFINDKIQTGCSLGKCDCLDLKFEGLEENSQNKVVVKYSGVIVFYDVIQTASSGSMVIKEGLDGFEYIITYEEDTEMPTYCQTKFDGKKRKVDSCEQNILMLPENTTLGVGFSVFDGFNNLMHEVRVNRKNAVIKNVNRGLKNLDVKLGDAPLVDVSNVLSCQVLVNDFSLPKCLGDHCNCLTLNLEYLKPDELYDIVVKFKDVTIFKNSIKTAAAGKADFKLAFDGFKFTITYKKEKLMPNDCFVKFEDEVNGTSVLCTGDIVYLPEDTLFSTDFVIVDGYDTVMHKSTASRVNANLAKLERGVYDLEVNLDTVPLLADVGTAGWCEILVNDVPLEVYRPCLSFSIPDLKENSMNKIVVKYEELTIFYKNIQTAAVGKMTVKEGFDAFKYFIEYKPDSIMPTECLYKFDGYEVKSTPCDEATVPIPEEADYYINFTMFDNFNKVIHKEEIKRVNAKVIDITRGNNNLTIELEPVPLIDEDTINTCTVRVDEKLSKNCLPGKCNCLNLFFSDFDTTTSHLIEVKLDNILMYYGKYYAADFKIKEGLDGFEYTIEYLSELEIPNSCSIRIGTAAPVPASCVGGIIKLPDTIKYSVEVKMYDDLKSIIQEAVVLRVNAKVVERVRGINNLKYLLSNAPMVGNGYTRMINYAEKPTCMIYLDGTVLSQCTVSSCDCLSFKLTNLNENTKYKIEVKHKDVLIFYTYESTATTGVISINSAFDGFSYKVDYPEGSLPPTKCRASVIGFTSMINSCTEGLMWIPKEAPMVVRFALADYFEHPIDDAYIQRLAANLDFENLGINNINIVIRDIPYINNYVLYCSIYVDDEELFCDTDQMCKCDDITVSYLKDNTLYNIAIKYNNITLYVEDIKTASYGVLDMREALDGFKFIVDRLEDEVKPTICYIFMANLERTQVACDKDIMKIPAEVKLFSNFTMVDGFYKPLHSSRVKRVNAKVEEIHRSVNDVAITLKELPIVEDEVNSCQLYLEGEILPNCILGTCDCITMEFNNLEEKMSYNVMSKYKGLTVFVYRFGTASNGLITIKEGFDGFVYTIEYQEDDKEISSCFIMFKGDTEKTPTSCDEDTVMLPDDVLKSTEFYIVDSFDTVLHKVIVSRVNAKISSLDRGIGRLNMTWYDAPLIEDDKEFCSIYVDGEPLEGCAEEVCSCSNLVLENLEENRSYQVVARYNNITVLYKNLKTASIGVMTIKEGLDGFKYAISYEEGEIHPTDCKYQFEGYEIVQEGSCDAMAVLIPSELGFNPVFTMYDHFGTVMHTVQVARVNARTVDMKKGDNSIALSIADAPLIDELNMGLCSLYVNGEVVKPLSNCYDALFEDFDVSKNQMLRVKLGEITIYLGKYYAADMIVREGLDGFIYDINYLPMLIKPSVCYMQFGSQKPFETDCNHGLVKLPETAGIYTDVKVTDRFGNIIYEVTVKRVNAETDNINRGLYNFEATLKNAPLINDLNNNSCVLYVEDHVVPECLVSGCDCLNLIFENLQEDTEYNVRIKYAGLTVYKDHIKTAAKGTLSIQEGYDGFKYTAVYPEGTLAPTRCIIMFDGETEKMDYSCLQGIVMFPEDVIFGQGFIFMDSFNSLIQHVEVKKVNAKIDDCVKGVNSVELKLKDAPLISINNDNTCRVYIDGDILDSCKNTACKCLELRFDELQENSTHSVVVKHLGVTVFSSNVRTASKGEIEVNEGFDGFKYTIQYVEGGLPPTKCLIQLGDEELIETSCINGLVYLPQEIGFVSQAKVFDSLGGLVCETQVRRLLAEVESLNKGLHDIELVLKNAPIIDDDSVCMVYLNGVAQYTEEEHCSCTKAKFTDLEPNTDYRIRITSDEITIMYLVVRTASYGVTHYLRNATNIKYHIYYESNKAVPSKCYPCFISDDDIEHNDSECQVYRVYSSSEFCETYKSPSLIISPAYFELFDDFASVLTSANIPVNTLEFEVVDRNLHSIQYVIKNWETLDSLYPCTFEGLEKEYECLGGECTCHSGTIVNLDVFEHVSAVVVQDDFIMLTISANSANTGMSKVVNRGMRHFTVDTQFEDDNSPTVCSFCLTNEDNNDNAVEYCKNESKNNTSCSHSEFEYPALSEKFTFILFDNQNYVASSLGLKTASLPIEASFTVDKDGVIEYTIIWSDEETIPDECLIYEKIHNEEKPLTCQRNLFFTSQTTKKIVGDCSCTSGRLYSLNSPDVQQYIIRDAYGDLILEHDNSKGKKSSKLSAGAIAGITVVVCIVVAVIIALAVVFFPKPVTVRFA